MANSTSNNVTGWSKQILKIHRPKNKDELRDIVRAARSTKIPLYPISKGFNWGYGSCSPVVDNCALLDLSGMNRIINADCISYDNPVAVIEPGVTQMQLFEFLQTNSPNLTFNVTGSGKDTSIIGNALDRGVGYLGPRKNDLFGLEIVTGTGEIMRTGFRRLGESSPLAHTHPFGLGPILDGLFSQSNFGIVTSACLKLFPRRPKEIALSLQLHKDSNLSRLIQELARLKREGLLTSVTHIANHARSRATLAYGVMKYLENECGLSRNSALQEMNKVLATIISPGWTSLSVVAGTESQVKATLKEIRTRVRTFAKTRIITDILLEFGYSLTHLFRFLPYARTHAAAISAMRPLHGLVHGIPTDIAVENLLWKFNHPDIQAEKLDQSRCGLLFISPALPMDGNFVTKTIAEMELIAQDYGHTLYITINIETDTSLVAITNLLFDRSIPAEINCAHECAEALLNYLHRHKLEVYRARADMMEKITAIDPEYWKMVYNLKQIFDPDNIISPGRYSLY